MEDKKRKKDDKRKRETSQKVSMFRKTCAHRHYCSDVVSSSVYINVYCKYLVGIWIYVRLIFHFKKAVSKIFVTTRFAVSHWL